MTHDRATVLAALRAEDVAAHYQINGPWRGRWMRSRRCAAADHGTEAFGLSRDGMFHCYACDTGGDLLKLIALGEKLDIRSDFSAVLDVAADIAGMTAADDWDAAPRPKKERAPLPAVEPIEKRIETARKRAAWVWDRMVRSDELKHSPADAYMASRGLKAADVRLRETIRETHLRCTPAEVVKSPELKSLAYNFAVPGLALPVRSCVDGALVDIRIRRYEPRPDQPKIIGMLGGVTAGPTENGRPRQLVGCYGYPHALDSDLVVVVEGILDYLTALCVWPNAAVLGAVEAGSMGLVAGHAARALAGRSSSGRLLIVEQHDGERTLKDGTAVAGAADRSVNEDPNAASTVAVRLLGPRRVGWLVCDHHLLLENRPVKDLNDLHCVGADIPRLERWWVDIQ
jgi:hypothetical protein